MKTHEQWVTLKLAMPTTRSEQDRAHKSLETGTETLVTKILRN